MKRVNDAKGFLKSHMGTNFLKYIHKKFKLSYCVIGGNGASPRYHRMSGRKESSVPSMDYPFCSCLSKGSHWPSNFIDYCHFSLLPYRT